MLLESLLPCSLINTHFDVRQEIESTGDKTSQLCTFCPKQFREFEHHILIQCSTFDHI